MKDQLIHLTKVYPKIFEPFSKIYGGYNKGADYFYMGLLLKNINNSPILFDQLEEAIKKIKDMIYENNLTGYSIYLTIHSNKLALEISY